MEDSIGSLPAELMQHIIRLTSLQAVASIWMSSRYWRSKLRNLMEHPKILFVTCRKDTESRHVFMLNNGLGYNMRVSRIIPRFRGQKSPPLTAKYGWFNTVAELEEFLAEFKTLIVDKDKDPCYDLDPEHFFLKIKYKEPSASYSDIISVMDKRTFDGLNNLIDKAQIAAPIPASTETFNGIIVCVKNSPTWTQSYIYINAEGDISVTTMPRTKLSQKIRYGGPLGGKMPYSKELHLPITVQLRTSSKIFKQLEDAIMYSKHTKSLPELDYDIHSCISMFDTRYVMDGKKYFVQEYTVNQNKELVVKTNGYKNNSIKKILHILESVLFDKSIPSPLYEGQVTPAPHTFTGHQLIRLPRYKMPVDADLPSVLAVELSVRAETYTLHLNSNVPLDEVVALFREVERSIDPKDTNLCKLAIDVQPNLRVIYLKVHSLKCFKPVTKLPKSIVVKVWNMLIRTGRIGTFD